MTYTEPLLLLFFAIGLVGLIFRPRGKALLLKVGLLGAFIISWPPVDWLFSRPLEAGYPIRSVPAPGPAQAIVVFSSMVERPIPGRPYPLPDYQTFKRCEYAAWLYGHWPSLPVLACGGRGGKRQPAYAVTMRRLLERAGVPGDMIWTEERSRSTHENARFGAEVLRAHGVATVILVVDASSMPRAAACFRNAGINALPAPSEFRELGSLQDELLPSWESIRRNEVTLHEMVGIVWYWLRGWI